MRVLAFDTTQAACSVAVYDSDAGDCVSHRLEKMQRGHAEALPGMIGNVMDRAGLDYAAIDRLAVTTGPGTFTGVRIGLAAARGAALALDIPVCGIGSLEAVAAAIEAPADTPVLAAFDARRGEVYAQLFEDDKAKTAPRLVSVDEAAGLAGRKRAIVAGTAASMLAQRAGNLTPASACPLPDARTVARLAAGRTDTGKTAEPVYLRKADAKPQVQLVRSTAKKVTLKAAGPDDAGVLAHLHASSFSRFWREDEFKTLLLSPQCTALMAIDDETGEPAGFVLVQAAADEAEILTLAVVPHARRKGVASTLLAAMPGLLARNEGIKQLFLEVGESNFAARHLYEKNGFVTRGLRKDYYSGCDGQPDHAIIMARKI